MSGTVSRPVRAESLFFVGFALLMVAMLGNGLLPATPVIGKLTAHTLFAGVVALAALACLVVALVRQQRAKRAGGVA